ncbi:hypothetical protein TNCV_578471 [Trichonephila clavipes]|nr:hypothetical protein TNCV_578471 [Trichonephila clavipes]
MLLIYFRYRGRGSLVVKVTDFRPACHEFELSDTEDPPCRGLMHFKFVGAPTTSLWCSVEARKKAASSERISFTGQGQWL